MRLRSWAPGEGLKSEQPKKPKRADMGRKPRVTDEKHKRAVSECPCVICGKPVQVAHIRMNAGPQKQNPGMGQKPPDRYVVPLCPEHHAEQHEGNEGAFWKRHGIDPLLVADDLYKVSPNVEAMRSIINKQRVGL